MPDRCILGGRKEGNANDWEEEINCRSDTN